MNELRKIGDGIEPVGRITAERERERERGRDLWVMGALNADASTSNWRVFTFCFHLIRSNGQMEEENRLLAERSVVLQVTILEDVGHHWSSWDLGSCVAGGYCFQLLVEPSKFKTSPSFLSFLKGVRPIAVFACWMTGFRVVLNFYISLFFSVVWGNTFIPQKKITTLVFLGEENLDFLLNFWRTKSFIRGFRFSMKFLNGKILWRTKESYSFYMENGRKNQRPWPISPSSRWFG